MRLSDLAPVFLVLFLREPRAEIQRGYLQEFRAGIPQRPARGIVHVVHATIRGKPSDHFRGVVNRGLRQLQRLLGPLALGDVLALCDGSQDRRAVFGIDVCRVPKSNASLAVLALDGDFHNLPPFGQRTLYLGQGVVSGLVGEEHAQVPADDLVGRVAGQALEGGIEPGDCTSGVPADDRSVGVAEEFLEVIAGLAQSSPPPACAR